MTTQSRFTVTEGDRVPFVLTWFPSHLALPEPVDAERALDDTERVLGGVGVAVHALRRLARRDPPLAAHAQGAHVRADRRHRRRADDLAARGDRRRAELGLPLLLAPRRDAHAARAARRRLQRGGARLARLAAPRRGRQPGRRPDHVRRGRASAGSTELELPWLPGYEGSQPVRIGNARLRAVPARRLRRGDRRVLPGRASARPAADDARLGAGARSCSSGSSRAGRSPTRASGRCAGRGGTSRTRRSWPGSRSTARCKLRRGVRRARARSIAGAQIRDEIHRAGARARASTPSATVRPVVRLRPARREPAHDPARRLPSAPTTRGWSARSRRSSASSCVDGFVERYRADDETRRRRPPAGRGRLPALLLLARRPRAAGPRRRGARLFERLLALRNDVGLSAEEYDPVGKRLLGNFPQAFTHLALVETAYSMAKLAPRESQGTTA